MRAGAQWRSSRTALAFFAASRDARPRSGKFLGTENAVRLVERPPLAIRNRHLHICGSVSCYARGGSDEQRRARRRRSPRRLVHKRKARSVNGVNRRISLFRCASIESLYYRANLGVCSEPPRLALLGKRGGGTKGEQRRRVKQSEMTIWNPIQLRIC
jgi:hypothetical protein